MTVWKFKNSQGMYGILLWLSGKTCFPIQIFLIFGGRDSHNFWNTELKFYRLLILLWNALSIPAKIIFSLTWWFCVCRKLVIWPKLVSSLLQKAYLHIWISNKRYVLTAWPLCYMESESHCLFVKKENLLASFRAKTSNQSHCFDFAWSKKKTLSIAFIYLMWTQKSAKARLP